jgi:nicotinate-nucleotide adenylyltransferase
MHAALPLAYPGQRIGLYGGSFDPAHEGHAHVAETALKRLGLDAVWWLVTPQNPLKPKSGALAARIASARAMARGSRMKVTAFEAAHDLHFTVDTLALLRRRFAGVHFVLIVGADSFASLARWRRWRTLMRHAPIAIVSRPGADLRARLAKPAQTFAHARKHAGAARRLAHAPGFVFLYARHYPQASSALRGSKP